MAIAISATRSERPAPPAMIDEPPMETFAAAAMPIG